jgi:DNA repair exonuclease SbcCD ATPase subunit
MKLTFDYMEISNFKCFHHLSFDMDEMGAGLHFIRGDNRVEPRLGSNGSGKSSLWGALTWCLYGRTPEGLKGPDIRPWSNKETSQVRLLFHNDDREYEVTRAAGPNVLLLDGLPTGQEQIDELIGLNADTFMNTVVLGQGQPLFFDLTPKAKMELFSTVLQLDKWDDRSKEASAKVNRLQVLEGQLDGEFKAIEVRQEGNDKELASLKERSAEWEEERQKKLDSFDADVAATKERLEKLAKQRDMADLSYDGAMAELKQIERDSERIWKGLNEAMVDAEKHDLKMAAWQEELDECRFELEQLPDNCSKCGQPLGGADRKKYKADLIKRLDKAADKIKGDKIGPRLNAKVEEWRTQERRLTDATNGFRLIAKEADAVLTFTRPLCNELEITIKSAEQNKARWLEEANPYHDQVQARRREKSKLKGQLRDLDERLNNLSAQIERTKFWTKGFRDVRLYVIDEVMQELELTTNALLADVGLPDWEVKYDVEKQTKAGTTQRGLTVTILSPHNEKPVKWESWSGGEGQRLRIVGALALADVLLSRAGVSIDLEVLDEPTRHLSSEGVRDLCDFLMVRAQHNDKAIWYVDHQSVESARFHTVTTVVKEKKGARIRLSTD